MRLKVPMASANESLIALSNRGHAVLGLIKQDYSAKKEAGRHNKDNDIPQYEEQINQWGPEVVAELTRIFPTALKCNLFLNPEIPFGAVSGDL